MKRIAYLLTCLLLFSAFVPPAFAQGETPYVIRSTKPIAGELREDLDLWLANDPPSSAPYYIVTYSRELTDHTLVSLAGVDLPSPDADWVFTDDQSTVWIGTVTVQNNGTVIYDEPVAHAPRLARPQEENGGGEYLAFPFAAGTSAQYGPRGVHGAGYGTSGMVAVDLVSGDDMGATAAPPYAYAADAGDIDYICEGDLSVAIRTHNEDTNDYFIYAHLLDNANLEIGNSFTSGEMIGSLKYGSFEDDCGWADQHNNHYHLHWGIAPAGGQYQVGGCTLSVSAQTWACGDDIIRTGGFLSGGGGSGGGDGDIDPPDDDPGSGGGSAVNDPTFFDYLLAGALSIVDRGIVQKLPEHEPLQYTYMLFNMVSLTLRLTWVLAASNISFYWLWQVVKVGIAVKAVFGLIWFVAFLFKAWKSLVPVLGA